MSLKMWLPLNKDDGNDTIINNGIEDYDFKYDNTTKISLPDSVALKSICYGGGKYIYTTERTGKNGNIYSTAYSTDGITWTSMHIGDADWKSVCYGNGKFVTLTNGNKAAYSTDGINWTQTIMPISAGWKSVCYGNGKFVAICDGNFDIAAYSTDGINWLRSTMPADNNWHGICYGNGKFVATCNSSNMAAYSTDGINWAKTTLPNSGGWNYVCYGNGKFVTFDMGNNIAAYSTDGINWTQTTLPTSDTWNGICYGNGKFVTVSNNRNGVAVYSTDGITWTQTTLPVNAYWNDICYGNGKFVAVASNNMIAYSYNGIIWRNISSLYTDTANLTGNTAIARLLQVSSSSKLNTILAKKATISFRYFNNTLKGNISGSEKSILFSTSEDNTLYIKANTSDSLYFALPTKLTANDWNTITLTIDNLGDSKSLQVYLNGKLEATKILTDFKSELDDTANLYNIAYNISPSYLVDYRIYDEILLEKEIKELALFTVAHFPLDNIDATPTHDLYFGKYENGNMNVSANEMVTKKVYDDHTDYTIKGNLNPLQSALTTNVLSDYFYNDKVLLNKIMVKVNRYKSGSLSIKSNRYENDDEGVSKTIIDENCDVGIWKEYDLYNSNIKDYIHYKDENGIIKTGKKISDDVYQEYNPYLEISGNDISIEKGTLPDRYTIKTGLYDSDEDKVMIPVNGTNKIITSSDKGRKWNIEELPETTNNHWNGIAKNDNIINITDNDSDTSIHSIYSTNNGNTWNKASKPLPGGGTTTLPASAIWFSVCYGNGKFVAVTMNRGIAAYSTDDINWTETQLPASVDWISVCYGNDKFVAVSRGNYYGSIAAYSTDGINWTKTTIPSKHEMQSVCYGNGKFVAVSGDEDAAYSTDGINWTGVTMPGDWWCSVCYGNGKFVAVTMNRGIAAYSTDGINWTKTTISSDDWQSVCYGNGKFVAIANGTVTASDIAAYSTDGITWTKTTLPASASWHNVCYGDGKFVAVAYNSNLVTYSTDGINWKQITMPNSDKWWSICYGDGKFVTLTNGNNLAAYSTDGITWSSLPVSCKSYGTAVYKNYTITVSNLGYYYLKQVNGEVTTSSFISKAFDNDSIIYNDLIIPKVGGTLQQITNMTDTEMTLTSHTLPATYTGNQLISNIILVYNDFYLLTVDCTDHILVGSTLDNITKVTLPESLQNKVWKGIEYFGTTIVLVTEDNKLVFASYKKKEDKTVDITINESNIKTINKTANSLTLKVDKELMVFPLQELEYSIVKMYTSMIDMDISIKKIQCIEDSNENAIALPYVENDKIIGEWKTSTLPTTGDWNSVCYGNGKFVAVTGNDSNKAAYSTDSITWTKTTLPASASWKSVCYGNGKFVAVAWNSNIAAYSTDGINWIKTTMPVSAYWKSVCYGNGKFVAVAYNSSNVAYSTDGITWTRTTLPTSAYWKSVCYGNGKFVAVASNGNGNNIAAYSTDGITWTRTTLPTSAYWKSVCYGNGKFVAVAYNSSNIAIYSTDGINWAQTTLPVEGWWQNVCYGNGKFVAVAHNSNLVTYSTDGITWTKTTLPTTGDWYSVCYGNGKFVAICDGITSNKAAYLVDEEIISSNLSDTKDLYYGSTNYKPIVRDSSNITILQSDNKNYYIGDGYSLVIKKAISSNDSDTFSNIFRYKDKDYAINTSDNAIWENDAKTSDEIKNNTFTKNEPTVDGGGTSTLPVSAYWSSVCYGKDKFVAICSNGSNIAAYSTDGINWTQTQLPIASDWISVCYGNGKFVAIIYNANFDIAAYSTDGINWTQTTLPVEGWWQNVCYGNGKFVAVASDINNIAIYSTDGINWTQTTLPVDAYWKSVCYGNGKFVAVAWNSNIAAYSTDGINWIKTTMPVSANWQSVCYGDGKYVAVAWNSEYAVYSIDGINWTQTTLPVKSNGNICYGNGKFVAVAYNSSNIAIYSTDGINWTKTVSYNTIPLTNYKLATTVDKYNNLLLLTNKEAFICPNTGDILKDTTAISTSTLSTDKLGTYISAAHSSISVFVSSVPTSSSYHGVCITTTKEGTVNTVTSIILPVKPPYKSIIVREGKFLVLPSTGNQLCVSPDGNKWDTIDLPVAGPYSCLYYDTKNILYLTLLSSDSIYYTRDLIHWHNYLLPEKVNISNVITNVHSTVFVTNNSTKCYYINMPETEYYYNDTPDISDYDGSEITVLRPTVLGEISPVGRRSLPMYREIPTMGTFINNVITVNSKFSISLWMNIHDLAPWYDISEWLLRAKITENNYGLGGIHTNHIDKNHMINSAKYFDEFTKGWNLYTLTVDINKGSSSVYINDSLLNSFVLTDAKSYFNNEIRISINGDINIDISDFKVYNKALTKDEISYIYNDTITNDCSAAIYSNNTVYSVGVKELADPFANNLIPITTDFEFYDKIHFGDSNVHSSGTVHHKIMVYHNFNSTIEPNKTSVKLDLSSISHMVIKGKKYIFSFKTQIPNISNLYYTIKINGAADSITDISNHTATASGKYVDISIPFTATGYDKLSIIIDYGATIGNKVPNDLYIGEVKLYPIDSDSPYIDKVNGIVANQIYESDLADEVTFAKDKIVCNKFITK